MNKKTILIILGIVFFIIISVYFMKNTIFKKVIAYIITKNEGSYINDPNDLGGETKFGISKRAYPKVDIKNLTVEQASEIYYKDYFSKLPSITDINLFYQVLDMAINAGVNTSLKLYAKNPTLESFKQARINYYKSLKQFSLYGQGWINRVNRNIV